MSALRRLALFLFFFTTAAVAGGACTEKKPEAFLTRDKMLDPQECASCHPVQHQEWSGSMHAYAAEDPVFIAMNERGQRETKGALGDFCVKCHAPMAVIDKLTTDGLNLDSVPKKYKGVTCFYCHTVDAVTGTHNAALRLSGDPTTMRAEYSDSIPNPAHASAYSPLHDRDRVESASMCGACHDIVTGHGAELERTFREWQQSVFSKLPSGATCSQCHMNGSATNAPIAKFDKAPPRRLHSHRQPGVDLALTDFPERDIQKDKVLELLGSTLQTALCVKQVGGQASVRVLADNVAAGHSFPSGSGQDRRLWFEVIAYEKGTVLYQSGVVKDGEHATNAMNDPDRWLLRDRIFDPQKKEVHMFWEASCFDTNLLKAQVTFDTFDPRFYQSHVYWQFPLGGMLFTGAPDRVTLRVRIQPIGLDILDDLIASKDLDPSVRAAMPTLDVGAPLEWTPAEATRKFFDPDNIPVACVTKTNFNVSAEKFPAPVYSGKCN